MDEEVIEQQRADDELIEFEEVNQQLHGLANQYEDDWATRVLGWAEDRNLIEGSNPRKQWGKLLEEVIELNDGIQDGDIDASKDAIGDCCVVLRIIAKQLNLHWDDCLESAWEEIKDRKGRIVNGVFVKEAS